MKIKKYKIQVVGEENYGYSLDVPQSKGVLCFSDFTEEVVFAKYEDIQEELLIPITCIEEFVQAMVDSEDAEFEVSYEVIGTYEEN